MARVDIVVEGHHRTVTFDDGPLPGRRYQAVVIGQVVDELTGSPLAVTVLVSSPLKGARPGHAANAVVGLAGVPERLFPKLDTQAYVITVRIDARGYQPVTAAVTLAPQPGFPATFVPADLGLLPARRTPVVLTGRTSRLGPLNRLVEHLELRRIVEVDRVERTPLLRPQLVEHAVLRHLEEPRRELAAEREARQSLEDAHEHFLGQVLGERLVAVRQPQHVVVDRCLVRPQDDRERTLIAPLGLSQNGQVWLWERQGAGV